MTEESQFDAILDIFFSKETCAVCKQEFNSLLLEHPKFDEKHKEYTKRRKEAQAILEQDRKSWDQLTDPLERFISKECQNLFAAKTFVSKWFKGIHENSIEPQVLNIPNYGELSCTMRAMAFNVSIVLEGREERLSELFMTTNYMYTVYGSELYNAMS